MSRKYNQPDDNDIPRRRDTIMQRRLRASRGEDEEEEEPLSPAYDDYDEEEEEIAPRRTSRRPPARKSSGGGLGCIQGMLYLLLGGLLTVIVILFLFYGMSGTIGGLLPGSFPWPQMIASPTPTMMSAATVIQRMQQLNRLQTTSYTVEKVIEASVQGDALENILFGDRLLLVAHGKVEAGVNLDEVSEEDIIISPDGQGLTVYLPPVRIFGVSMDNEKTRVYDRERGLLAAQNKDLETQARQYAEQAILQAACEGDIMQQATDDSQQAMQQFLSLLNFEQVQVIPAAVPECGSAGVTPTVTP